MLGKTNKRRNDLGIGNQNPQTGMTLVEKIQSLRKANKEIKRLNGFLEEASAFFARSRRKWKKRKIKIHRFKDEKWLH